MINPQTKEYYLRFIHDKYKEHNYFTDLDLMNIVEGCSQLREVVLLGCDNLTDKSVVYLADWCKWLKKLELNYCKITDKSIECLCISSLNLSYLSLIRCFITEEGIDNIVDTPRIKTLFVRDCPYVKKFRNTKLISHGIDKRTIYVAPFDGF